MIFGFIGGIVSGIGSAIGSAVSSIASAIGGVVGSIATGIGNLIARLPDPFGILDKISDILMAVGAVFGVCQEDENIGELGAKAMQPEAKKPEDFDSIEKYINHLHNEIEFDKDAFEKKSDIEKVGCQILGSSIVTKGIEEKTGMELSPEFLVLAAKFDMKREEVTTYMDEFKSAGINNMGVMVDCLDGRCDKTQVNKVTGVITDSISKLNPAMSEKEVDSKLASMMDEVASLKETNAN